MSTLKVKKPSLDIEFIDHQSPQKSLVVSLILEELKKRKSLLWGDTCNHRKRPPGRNYKQYPQRYWIVRTLKNYAIPQRENVAYQKVSEIFFLI